MQGDWKAQIGKDVHKTWQGRAGRFGHEKTNERGERLIEFAKKHNLVVTDALYKHKTSRTTTWHSPRGLYHKQIYFILLSKRSQSGVNGAKTRAFPSADVGSDHDLVVVTMKIKRKKRSKH